MRKKEFTSFDVAATVRELKETILDSRISNVYQLNNKTLLLKLHKPDNPNLRLILEAGRRLHLTAYAEEKPSTPPAFCMALRKYMRNSWLTNVEQYEFERIVTFSIKSKLGNLQLVLELFGEGNLILVDENGVILQALTYKRMRDRNIIRGEKFAFAPPSGKNPFKISREEFANAIFGFRDVEVVRALARFLGIGGLYAEEVLLRANVEKTKPCNTLSQSEVNALFDCLQLLLSRISSGKLEPCIVLDDSGEFLDVTPFKLRRYEAFKHHGYDVFNMALDEFYVRATAVEKALAGVEIETLKREAERLQRIIESQERVFAEAEAKAERDRNIGNAIYMHANELQALISRFLNEKKSGKEWKTIISEILAEKKAGLKPSLFFESFDAEGLVINVFVDGLRFGLGLRDKIFDVASQFYERSKKSKQKLEGAKTALEETRKQLAEVEAKIREVEALERAKPAQLVEEITKRKIKPKEWFEKFRWFISSDGFLIVAGKDAVSNEVLIKKYTDKDDVVFHADIIGAPFATVKSDGKNPTEQCLKEAGEFAAAFSRAWREGFASVDVYWVKPNQLSKGGPSGEYVPKGAFVVSGKRNWMHGTPLKIAIGITLEDDEIKFVGGPEDAVKAKTKNYVTIVPGDQTGKELLKRVLKILASKVPKEKREKVLKASIEQIREYVPYNKGKILGNYPQG